MRFGTFFTGNSSQYNSDGKAVRSQTAPILVPTNMMLVTKEAHSRAPSTTASSTSMKKTRSVTFQLSPSLIPSFVRGKLTLAQQRVKINSFTNGNPQKLLWVRQPRFENTCGVITIIHALQVEIVCSKETMTMVAEHVRAIMEMQRSPGRAMERWALTKMAFLSESVRDGGQWAQQGRQAK